MLTDDQVQKIVSDTLADRPQRIKGPDADRFRKELAKDLAKAKKNGWIIDVPSEVEVKGVS